MSKYFMTVGVTPQACANSLSWYLRSENDPEIDEVYFITSWDDGEPSAKGENIIQQVCDLSKQISSRMAPKAFEKIEFRTDDIIWIPEADLPVATKIIAKALLERCPEGCQVVVDTTAGRKMMTGSALVASLLVHQKYGREVFISYYLLHDFSREKLAKKAYELGLDDAETILISVDDLDAEVKKIEPAA